MAGREGGRERAFWACARLEALLFPSCSLPIACTREVVLTYCISCNRIVRNKQKKKAKDFPKLFCLPLPLPLHPSSLSSTRFPIPPTHCIISIRLVVPFSSFPLSLLLSLLPLSSSNRDSNLSTLFSSPNVWLVDFEHWAWYITLQSVRSTLPRIRHSYLSIPCLTKVGSWTTLKVRLAIYHLPSTSSATSTNLPVALLLLLVSSRALPLPRNASYLLLGYTMMVVLNSFNNLNRPPLKFP